MQIKDLSNQLYIIMQVRYLSSEVSFNYNNLEVSIQLNGKVISWKPIPANQENLDGNLKGTIRVRLSKHIPSILVDKAMYYYSSLAQDSAPFIVATNGSNVQSVFKVLKCMLFL